MENKSNEIIKSIFTPVIPNYGKRIAAFILDAICVFVVGMGFALLFSFIFDFDSINNALNDKFVLYGIKYLDENGVLQTTSVDAINYDVMWNQFYEDEVAVSLYNKVVDLTILIPALALGFSLLIFELIVPIILKHGRTIGYFVFKIALISNDDIEIKFIQLFIRFLIGKLIINGLVLGICILMIIFGRANIFIALVAIGIILINLGMLLFDYKKVSIPDKIAKIYPCEYEGQMFFRTLEELNLEKGKEAYRNNAHKDY